MRGRGYGTHARTRSKTLSDTPSPEVLERAAISAAFRLSDERASRDENVPGDLFGDRKVRRQAPAQRLQSIFYQSIFVMDLM
jgi:hypothetical protein